MLDEGVTGYLAAVGDMDTLGTRLGAVLSNPARGRQMVPLIRGCVAAIEKEWASHLGARRFGALRDALQDLSVWLGKLG